MYIVLLVEYFCQQYVLVKFNYHNDASHLSSLSMVRLRHYHCENDLGGAVHCPRSFATNNDAPGVKLINYENIRAK